MADENKGNGDKSPVDPDQISVASHSPTAKEGSKLLVDEKKDSKYPKSVFFIVSNEFCERFSYYGMRAILILYLTTWLGFDSSTATAIYHSFVVLCYFTPVLGAIIADGYLGKYRTILYVSLVYAAGNIVMTFTAFPPPYWVGPMFGLILIGLGTGGIKPCVSAFGGDQFSSEQEKQREQFFSVFYFAINLGSFLSMIITPLVRESVQCFGNSCFPVAFGIPAALMLLSVALFVFGRRYYKIYPPTGSVIRQMICCIGRAIKNKVKRKSSESKDYWLYHADDKYDMAFLDDVRRVLHVFWLFLPLPVFWALFDQQGSRWTLQSAQLDLQVFGHWFILPDQVQAINSILILAFIPLFEIIIYPLLSKCKVPHRPIQRMVGGMLLAAVAFLMAGGLQTAIDKSLSEIHVPVGSSKLSVINTSPCLVNIRNPAFVVDQLNYSLFTESLVVPSGNHTISLSHECANGIQDTDLPVELGSQQAYFVLVSGKQPVATLFEYPLKKPGSGGSLISFVYVDHSTGLYDMSATMTRENDPFTYQLNHLQRSSWAEVFPGKYSVSVNGNNSIELRNVPTAQFVEVDSGAVITVILEANGTSFHFISYTNVKPNSVTVWLQFPQYIVITAAEILFSITGLSFGYSQAPESMKSVVTAAWLLTTAFGDLIVVIVAGVQLFSQTVEFFFFAILMTVTTVIFAIMGYFYKYVDGTVPGYDELTDSDTNQLTSAAAPIDTAEAVAAEHH